MARADQLVIEVVLDDGTIQKQVINLKEKAEQAGKKIGDSFNIGPNVSKQFGNMSTSLSSAITKAGLFAAALGAAVFAAKQFFDVFKEIADTADQVKKVDAQFDSLSKNAGGSPDLIREAFERLSNGIIENTEILKAANVGLSNLSIGADALVKNFETARRVSVGFGVDTLDAFNAINTAVQSGQTRMLRSIGIFVNAETAVKNYAKSIGLSTEFLTEAQKQQAIFNAIQVQSEKNFSNINLEAQTTAISFKQFGTAVSELGEATSIALNKMFGPAFQATLALFTDALKAITRDLIGRYGNEVQQAAFKKQQLIDKISETEKLLVKEKQALEEANDAQKGFYITGVSAREALLKSQKLELALMEEIDRKRQSQLSQQEQQANKNKQSTEEEIRAAEAIKNARLKLAQDVAQIEGQNVDFRLQNARTEEEMQAAFNEKKILMENENQFRLQEIKNKFAAVGLANTQAAQNAEAIVIQNGQNRVAEFTKNFNANMVKVRQIAQSALVNGIANAFSAVGAALVRGQNGFEAFGKAVLTALGSMAIQIGTLLITIGTGFAALGPVLPIFGLSGAKAIAAGIGLVILGGALMALGGGGEGAPATGGGGAGGGAGGSPEFSPTTQLPSLEEKAKPKTEVVINVEGNILDRRETGLAIVDVLNEFFDTSDGVVART